jgi:hypothetical protein
LKSVKNIPRSKNGGPKGFDKGCLTERRISNVLDGSKKKFIQIGLRITIKRKLLVEIYPTKKFVARIKTRRFIGVQETKTSK